ncbi:hypothetical protein H0A36_15160 [Endozoicomonas sp. SM1973]|uniref:DUF4252 domain-containing protein n=1 Tax=Spartinivicinus marinus TaxID=2994442 RepID=A0A853IDU8_9GAMM|nr:hypothetical protein [Spartinivicinus marinus]MCX4026232.1 hypothetical protein [Spartinivicinus marinus]NYZ67355.1 hypothetical protein [Spartinivicinus marinus]
MLNFIKLFTYIICLYILSSFCAINAQELSTIISGAPRAVWYTTALNAEKALTQTDTAENTDHNQKGTSSIIAIFDYDRRDANERTVASYIEDKILSYDNKVIVKQFSGENDNNASIKTLHYLDSSNYKLIITITSDAMSLARYIVKQTPMLFTY